MVEMLVTLVVIGVLAAVVVPTFALEARRARAAAEVVPALADLRLRIEGYREEHGRLPPSIGEGAWHPAAPPGAARSWYPMPAAWLDLRVRPSGTDRPACSYTWATGAANDRSNAGGIAAALGFVVPETEWWYVVGWCDMDLDGRPAWYLASSVSDGVVARDAGE